MISESQYDALLRSLYAGSTDPGRMSEFLRTLGNATDSHVTTFVHADLENPAASSLLTIGAAPDEVLKWSEHAGENPWMQSYLPDMHAGGICNGDAYVSRKELMASQYYDGFLRHIDTQHSLGICAAHQKNHAAFLMLCRSGPVGAYDEDSLQLFKRLAPHVVNAFALQMQFEHLNAQSSLITRHKRGMFLLDSQWRWVGGNPVAEQMVASGWWRGRINSRLQPTHPLTRAAWQSLQRKLQSNETQQVMAVHDKQGVLAAFASLHVYGAAAVGEHVPCYVMFVRPLHSSDTGAVNAQLMQIFGLTASEATLALALRQHTDIAHAASAIGIAEASARTRLQVIFEKTASRRQADLLLLIDALVETVA